MATEHEIGRGEGRDFQMDGELHTRGGWEDTSTCRYNPGSSWRPWGDTDIPLSAGEAESSGGGWGNGTNESPQRGSTKALESADNYWGRASESADDGWGEASHDAESPKASWGKAPQSAGDGWDDLYDPDCELEESQDADTNTKCSGLTNLGNTCFMNSVLQCLTYTVPFANRILNSQHRTSCKAQEFCAMCAIENHIKVVLSASGRTVSPAFLACNLDQVSRSFVPGQQQDAHEFLFFLLEGMQEYCKTDGSCRMQSMETNIVSEIFMGQMKSQVKCKACSHCSDSVEPFLGLNLEIENCDSVREALSNYVAVEDLQEEAKISCSHCKEAASRSKQLSFSKSPQVLVVQLKRYKASEFFPTKIERDIKYDMSLDLTPFVNQVDATTPVEESDWNYSLYAVLVHSGWSTSSGHYYCYVQTSPGLWHCMNDSLVSRASERTVLHQEAYILFYIRKGFKEKLQIENALSANQEVELSGPQFQASEAVDDPYLLYSPIKADSALNKRSLLNIDMKDSLISSQVVSPKPLESSDKKKGDIELDAHIICSPVKSPDISKQVVAEKDIDKNTPLHAQQASKHSQSSSKGRSLHEFEDPKQSSCVKIHSVLKPERISSPSPTTGCNQVVFDSFENGSQYSYVRLCNRMPAGRRQALLASAMSGQEATKRSSPKATSAAKPANASKQTHLLQAGMERATSHLLQKAEQQDAKGKLSSREKPWAEDHDLIDSRKLQRVGGKRVLASFRNSGVHQVPGEAKANIV